MRSSSLTNHGLELRDKDTLILLVPPYAATGAKGVGQILRHAEDVEELLRPFCDEPIAAGNMRRLLGRLDGEGAAGQSDAELVRALAAAVATGRLSCVMVSTGIGFRAKPVAASSAPASPWAPTYFDRGELEARISPLGASARPGSDEAAPGVPSELGDRFKEVLSRIPKYLPDDIAREFGALISPESLVMMAGILALWAVSHLAGIGFVIDAGLLAVGIASLGYAAIEVFQDLIAAVTLTIQAKSSDDLDEAALKFAKLIAKAGVAVFVALLTRGLGRRHAGAEAEKGTTGSATKEIEYGKSSGKAVFSGSKRGRSKNEKSSGKNKNGKLAASNRNNKALDIPKEINPKSVIHAKKYELNAGGKKKFHETIIAKKGKNKVKITIENFNISSIEAEIKNVFHENRDKYQINKQKIAMERGISGDEGGHYLAFRFFGDIGIENVFPQNARLNRSAYKKLENEWADWIRLGNTVKVKIVPKDFVNGRPSKISITYQVIDKNGNPKIFSRYDPFSDGGERRFVDFDNVANSMYYRIKFKDMVKKND